MQYMKVLWKHAHPNEPVTLYSELDDARRETRKVEVFRDGQLGYAGVSTSKGSTALGIVPIPPISQIALDPEFEPSKITRDEFEQIWRRAISS